jgi:hypothetical protein
LIVTGSKKLIEWWNKKELLTEETKVAETKEYRNMKKEAQIL